MVRPNLIHVLVFCSVCLLTGLSYVAKQQETSTLESPELSAITFEQPYETPRHIEEKRARTRAAIREEAANWTAEEIFKDQAGFYEAVQARANETDHVGS